MLTAVLLQSAWVSWLALQLSVMPVLLYRSAEQGLKSSVRSAMPMVLSSLLLAAGFWIGISASDQFTHQVGIVLLCVGVGGLTGWFPVIAKTEFQVNKAPLSNFVSHSLIPVCLGALFFFRCVHAFEWNEEDLALLAVVSLFSLAVCGIRLMGSLSIQQRMQLSILTILCNANIATILSGWEKLFSERTWEATSNIPSGAVLFVAVLITESTAVVLMLFCLRGVPKPNSSELTEAELVQELNAHRWLRKLFLIGNLSLAGFPLLPGALWRFALLMALTLPHQRSNVTQLAEPHLPFIYLAIGYMLVTILSSVGQVRLLQLLMVNQTFNKETQNIEAASATS